MPSIEIPMPNLTTIQMGDTIIWFSYTTPVAFSNTKTGRIVRQNEWSTTTGKHLNYIDGGGEAKKRRVDRETFEAKLREAGLM